MATINTSETAGERMPVPRMPTSIYADDKWKEQGLCNNKTGAMVEMFYSLDADDVEAAKKFCGGCAVKAECLETAKIRREPRGVWGGEEFHEGVVVNNSNHLRGRKPNKAP